MTPAAVPKTVALLTAIALLGALGFLFGRADPCLGHAYLGVANCSVFRSPAGHVVTLALLVSLCVAVGFLGARWLGGRVFAIAPPIMAGAMIAAFVVQQLAPGRGLRRYYEVFGWGQTLHEISLIVLASCGGLFALIATAWITLKFRDRG
jgi:hypothetical protein